MSDLKQCTVCLLLKPATEEYFYKQKKTNKKDGIRYYLKSECKECSKVDTRKRMYSDYEKHKLRNAEYDKITHPENCIKRRRKAYLKNITKEKQTYNEFVKNNPDKMRNYRKKHKNHDVTLEEWNICKKSFNSSCAYCGLTLEEHISLFKQDLHKDHVVHDGSNEIDNCVPACKSCNSEKHDKLLEDWYNENNPKFKSENYNKIKRWQSECYEIIDKYKIIS